MATIQEVYIALFGRPADPAGYRFYVDATNDGANLDAVGSLANSPEYLDRFEGKSNIDMVNQIFLDLFGRPADAEGLLYYVGLLQRGEASMQDIAIRILDGATGTDQDTIDNKVEAANLFTQSIDTAEEISAYQGDEAAQLGRDFLAGVTADDATVPDQAAVDAAVAGVVGIGNPGEQYDLTTGPDTIVGTANDDTIDALPVNATGGGASTFTAFDSIDGGAGTDTLNIFADVDSSILTADYNVSFPANASVRNVEIVNINWINGVSNNGSFLNVANYDGIEQLWQAGAAGNVINATDDVTVGYRDVAGGTRTITTATGESTVNVALDNSAGTVTTNGATTVNVSGEKATGAFTLNVNNTAAATSVSVNTAVATTIATALAAVTTVDASASTGDITYTTSADVSVRTGSGDDVVNVNSALGANAVINLGAGDDTLQGSFAPAANGTFDGGEGRDTVASTLINAGNGGKFVNFEVLGLNNTSGALDLNLLTGSNIESLELLAAGGTYTNVDLDQGLLVEANLGAGATVTTLTFEGATGADDSYTITFDRDAGAVAPTAANTFARTVDLDRVEDINVVSEGSNAWNAITLSGDNAETVTVSGAANLDLSFAAGFGVDAAGSEVTLIDASGATGDITINLANVVADAAGLTVVGGSGDDSLITSTFASTLAGGAGDDLFNVTAATYAGAGGVITTITDFSAGDVIDFNGTVNAGGTGVVLGAAVDVGTATTLAEAFTTAFAATGETVWFSYAGNTYLVHDEATDHVVQLTGVMDLSTSLYNSTQDSLIFA